MENPQADSVYLGTDGISLGSNFSVNADGAMTAKSGTIGGWNIQPEKLSANNVTLWAKGTPYGTNMSPLRFSAGFRSSSALPSFTSGDYIEGQEHYNAFGPFLSGDLPYDVMRTIYITDSKITGKFNPDTQYLTLTNLQAYLSSDDSEPLTYDWSDIDIISSIINIIRLMWVY